MPFRSRQGSRSQILMRRSEQAEWLPCPTVTECGEKVQAPRSAPATHPRNPPALWPNPLAVDDPPLLLPTAMPQTADTATTAPAHSEHLPTAHGPTPKHQNATPRPTRPKIDIHITNIGKHQPAKDDTHRPDTTQQRPSRDPQAQSPGPEPPHHSSPHANWPPPHPNPDTREHGQIGRKEAMQ